MIEGVEGTYDRHDYEKEKAAAFEALAAEIDRIVNPPDPAKVIQMNDAKKRGRKKVV